MKKRKENAARTRERSNRGGEGELPVGGVSYLPGENGEAEVTGMSKVQVVRSLAGVQSPGVERKDDSGGHSALRLTARTYLVAGKSPVSLALVVSSQEIERKLGAETSYSMHLAGGQASSRHIQYGHGG